MKNLQNNNEFPIIFIGSGITKRYFENAPTWDQLLQKLWGETHDLPSYFAEFHKLKNKFGSKDKNNFSVFTKLATELEKQYDQEFYDGRIKIKGLSIEKAHYEEISPFRQRIANIFLSLKLKSDYKAEVADFFKMLKKAKLIITTNYDNFIENNFKKIDVKVGNKGLFEDSAYYNELYKIHGSVSDANSIVITEDDYNNVERTSAIVDAKILSQLTRSPIIFFGYSLSDKSIQILLRDLSISMPFPIDEAASRIGVVDYKRGKQDVDEVMADTTYGVYYTKLSTDNFRAVYKSIAKVNQGISPYEISKYENAFKKIIETRGKQGRLDKVLTSFADLDKLPEELKSKNLVVAFGDSRYIYKIPTYTDYIKDYFLGKEDMPLKIAVQFIKQTPSKSTLPIAKYVAKIKKEKFALDKNDREKINGRLKRFNSIDSLNIQKISNKYTVVLKGLDLSQPEKIFSDDKIKPYIKLNYITTNIRKFDQKSVLQFIKYILLKRSDKDIKDTNCRKLFMAYSLLYDKKVSNL